MVKSLRQIVYQLMIKDITCGRLFPGERLIETKLTERYKVSRSTIREALRQLEGEGLIKLEEYKGIIISKPSIEEVENIFNLRAVLESYSVRLASEKMTKSHLEHLRDLNGKLKEAANFFDLPSWIKNNILFHDFFSEICGNHILGQILTSLKRRVYIYHFNIVNIPGHFKTYIKQHEAILKACQKKMLRWRKRICELILT
jgi:DNA-binding GntR family transcriptional regulator